MRFDPRLINFLLSSGTNGTSQGMSFKNKGGLDVKWKQEQDEISETRKEEVHLMQRKRDAEVVELDHLNITVFTCVN